MRRALAALLCLLSAVAAQAQIADALDASLKTVRYYGLFPSPRTSNPVGMSGFGPLEPSKFQPTLPPPSLTPGMKVNHQGTTSDRDGTLHVEGGVDIEYKGYRMTADVMDGNRFSDVYVLSGNAMLVGPDAVLTGHRILIDYRHKSYEAYESESDIRPTLVGGELQTDVYARSLHATGNGQEEFLTDSRLTTCNYAEPHYYLESKYTDIRFGQRIIFRELQLWITGHHIFNLPFLVVPLDDRRYQNLPLVGEDSYEGYFVKNKFGIPLKGNQAMDARVDYMTKLGLGLGEDYTITKNGGKDPFTSTLNVYGVSNIQMLDVTQSHDERYGWGRVQLQNTLTKNDYLTAPGNTTLNSRASVEFDNKQGNNTLQFNLNTNDSTGFESTLGSFGFASSETFGQFRETAQITYTDSNSSYNSGTGTTTTTDRKEIDISFRAEDDLKKALAMFEYQRAVPVGTIQNFVSITDRTPNVTLSSDSTRVFGSTFGRSLPIKADVAIGQFGDPQSGLNITRDLFDISFDKEGDSSKRFHIDTQGSFTQEMYSDNTAQYVVGTNDDLSYRLGKDTSFNVRYSYLKSEGYTPLGIDQVGSTNLLSEDVSFRPERPLLIGVQSSYDFAQAELGSTGWSPIGLRAEYQPHEWISTRFQATYDPYLKGVANYRFDATYRPGATLVGLAARYDNTLHQFAEVDLYISALKYGRLKSDVRLSYDGYTKQFNSIQTSLVYDLHDAEAVLQLIDNPVGFQSGTQVLLFIRLKGLPFDTSFGTGTRGQPFGYGSGIGY